MSALLAACVLRSTDAVITGAVDPYSPNRHYPTTSTREALETPVSWEPTRELTFEEWAKCGGFLLSVRNGLNWQVGDWLNYGERKLGEQAAQLYDLMGWEYHHVRGTKTVAACVKPATRVAKLSWSHHREVASLSDAEQRRWLTLAAEGKWSKRRLVEELRNAGLRGAPEPAPELVPDHMNAAREPGTEWAEEKPRYRQESESLTKLKLT